MTDFKIRKATISDISFLVDTIIEAEKSGTNVLSYTTVFGLTEQESRDYIAKMLSEEVDDCELSISSFIIAERDGQNAAAVAAWIEGNDGIPSLMLKGNLLNYILPKESSSRAIKYNHLLRDLHIEYQSGTLALGLVYVAPAYRGLNLVKILIDERVRQLLNIDPKVTEMYVQVFGNNLPAIRAYEKANFKVVLTKESKNAEILQLLPSDKKVLMKNDLLANFKEFYTVNKINLINFLILINTLGEEGQFITSQL